MLGGRVPRSTVTVAPSIVSHCQTGTTVIGHADRLIEPQKVVPTVGVETRDENNRPAGADAGRSGTLSTWEPGFHGLTLHVKGKSTLDGDPSR